MSEVEKREETKEEEEKKGEEEEKGGGGEGGSAPPVFGSAATFAAGGFGGFTGIAPGGGGGGGGGGEDGGEGEGEGGGGGEEECQAEFKPVVTLDEVAVKTGEEEEEEKFSGKAKMYRFDDGEWKERGVGPIKVLEHKTNGMIRILMRRDKTLKICANHLIAPGLNLSSHMDNEKAFVWSALDYADEEPKTEMLCIRFGTEERAALFKKAVDEAEEKMKVVMGAQGKEEEEEEEEKKEEEEKEEEKEVSTAEADALAEELETAAKVEDA